jgi:RNA polymerase sigma factor (sigma-70 family)
MSVTALTMLIGRCRVLCRPRSPSTDAELVRRFTQEYDATAFEELLERHAGLVWGVCRRNLPDEADCEDAFQATFFALVRRADSIEVRSSLGAWLHTVAVRVARKAQARRRRQRPLSIVPERATPGNVTDQVDNRELFRLVDEEIERLPVALRLPLVLCCLQGQTRDEAAETLGCSLAAVKSRLERGRSLLRRRLQRRGIEAPAAFLALGLTGGRIRAALWGKTIQAALYSPAAAVAALADAGVSAVAMGWCKLLLAALLLVSSVAGAVGLLLTAKAQAPQAAPAPSEHPGAEPKAVKPSIVRTDRHGDPLPKGALARLGTVRWRHGFFVLSLAYSPDGKMIAAVGAGRDITLWDAATGKEIYQFPNKGDQPNSLAFSPDGKILATGGSVCHLWDVATGKELRQLRNGRVAFSPDGKLVATASMRAGDNTVRLWDVANGKEQLRVECGSSQVCGLAYSPDGKRIASSDLDGTIHLWDLATGKEQHRLSGHKKGIWRLAFSPDGKRLASSSEDETIRLWDPSTGRQVRLFGEKLGVYSSLPIAFSPDGALLASGHQGGIIRLWEVRSGEEKRRWQSGVMAVRAVAFSPDGKTLASGAAWEGIRRWDVASGREKQPAEEHRGFVDFLRYSPDGATLVSVSRERRMLWWDLATQTPRRDFSWTGGGVAAFDLSHDGRTLVVGGGSDLSVHLWDLRTGKPGRTLGKLRASPWSVVFSPDGRLVAAGGEDREIHVWEVSNGRLVQQIKGIANVVLRLRFSPDSKSLACGTQWRALASGEPTLLLWDMATGKERVHFDRTDSYFPVLAFSPDGKVLACNSGEREEFLVRLLDTSTGKEIARHTGHREDVASIAFSSDGKLVASGTGGLGLKQA